jgi:Tannase and feruloyl esterase
VTLNFDRDPDLARQKVGALLDADNANLDEFRKRGGKLLVYHGWADHMVPQNRRRITMPPLSPEWDSHRSTLSFACSCCLGWLTVPVVLERAKS